MLSNLTAALIFDLRIDRPEVESTQPSLFCFKPAYFLKGHPVSHPRTSEEGRVLLTAFSMSSTYVSRLRN
jgi:hypothetical protein